jgi:hypothetical protein
MMLFMDLGYIIFLVVRSMRGCFKGVNFMVKEK